MATKKYVVRVVVPVVERQMYRDPPPDVGPTFLECLRYAGLVEVHENNDERKVFDIKAPYGLDSLNWSRANAERMKTFGYNAVSAPSTDPVT